MSPVSREGNKFCQRLTVPCYDTDAAFLLKPAAFMDMAQEIAYWAAHELGFGYDDLQRHHTAWVLSRMHVHFGDPPRWRDEVILKTWHKGQNGLFFLRDFELLDPKGRPLVTATSSWLVMDVQTRRLVRDPLEAGLLRAGAEGEGDAIAEPAPKLAMPSGQVPDPAGEHVVSYSDVDLLGHANNARYIVWAMDCLGYDAATEPRIRDLYVNFNKETVPGSAVQLCRTTARRDALTSHFVEGRVDGKPVFCVQMDYQR